MKKIDLKIRRSLVSKNISNMTSETNKNSLHNGGSFSAAISFAVLVIFVPSCMGKISMSGNIFHGGFSKFNVIRVHLSQIHQANLVDNDSDEFSKTVPEMLSSYGYGCQVHHYITDDGYINTLHRIISSHKGNGKVVFLQHGLVGTSADFVMGSPEKSLGYILADLGYDVWMGNARGNEYSRNHTTFLDENGKLTSEYWKFSWDEMGKFDIPAAISYVTNNTGSDKVYYVGHSMGTTIFWVAANENPKFLLKISLMIAMAPVAKVEHMRSPIRYLAPLSNHLEFLLKILGIDQFEPSNEVTEMFMKYACDETMIELELCRNIFFLLTGFDYRQMNMTLLPYILGHEPGGTSTRTLAHFAQEVNSGKFCKFDYGKMENIKRYGVQKPPSYDLRKVDVPVALIWSDNDWLADPKDVSYLVKNLPKLKINDRVTDPKFNHIDFLWAIDAPKLVYSRISYLLREF